MKSCNIEKVFYNVTKKDSSKFINVKQSYNKDKKSQDHLNR